MLALAEVTSLHAKNNRESLEARRLKRREISDGLNAHASSRRAGFSARLNMLCSLAGERELARGRLEDICELREDWASSEVQSWLTEDWVPTPKDLDHLIRFLTKNLSQNSDPRQWEAYLLCGSECVANPLLEITSVSDQELSELASLLLMDITREYRIPPHSYDADKALADTITALQDLNVSSSREELQAGHRRIVATRVFGNLLPGSYR